MLLGFHPMAKQRAPQRLDRFFGQILQQARIKRGLSQEDLGFESGYHRTYISMLERGLRNPSLKTVFQLAKVLEVSPSKLVQDLERKMVR